MGMDLIIKGANVPSNMTKTWAVLRADDRSFFTELRFRSPEAAENWIRNFGFKEPENARKKKR